MFKNSRRVLINFILFLLALFIYLGVDSYYRDYLQLPKVAETLEAAINEEREEVAEFVSSKETLNFGALMGFAAEEPYRDFFILNKDSIIYYTSNELIISNPCVFSDSNSGYCLTQTPNRSILFHKEVWSPDTSLIHVISLKNRYSVSNRFLVNNWVVDRDIPKEVMVHQTGGSENVSLESGFQFFLSQKEKPELYPTQSRILFVFFLITFTMLLVFVYVLYDEIRIFETWPLLKIPSFIVDITLLLLLLSWLEFPSLVFKSYIFEESIFLFPSVVYGLGQAVIFSVAAFIVSIAVYQWKKEVFLENRFLNILLLITFVLATIAALFFSYMMVKNLVFNSEFTIKISEPVQLSAESVFGLMVLSLTLISAWVFATTFIFYLASFGKSPNLKRIIYGLGAISLLVVSLTTNWLYLFLLLQYLVIGVFAFYHKLKVNIYYILVLILVSALGYSVIIEKLYYDKDKKIIELRAMQILNNRDKLLEARISDRTFKIRQDSIVKSAINKKEFDYKSVEKYVAENYFSFLKQNYETELTLCDSTTQLLVDFEEEATGCYGYFDGIVQELGRKSLTKGLYYIDDGDAVRNYLLKIPVNSNQKLFVDIFEKNSPFTQGYPELLEMESDKKRLADKFDYAIYWDDDLISSFGDHSYPLVFNEDELMRETTTANYLFSDGRKKIVISLERNHLTNAIAGTSYLFIAFGFIFFFFNLLLIQKVSREYQNRFRNRLQASIFSILLLTFVVIGYFMFTHIVHQNTDKNVANLKQLSHSILIELEHKFSQFDDIEKVEQEYTFSQLVKFSKVFFSDINLYDPSGKLISSSRPQVFERDIISDRIHKEAFVKLRQQSLRMFIMREKIGNYEFLSSYFPLRNYNNDIIAYANLPYFARQKRLTEEIADFLTTFINIYVVLTVLSLFLIWITSNYITKPMETIKKSLRQTKLAKSNIKIEMNRKDEIGELVQEYNSMVDELEQSAKKLAVSERESAWREMAKQVAHEIKNPLTPMKLSVQHINRVINTSDDESKKALKRFTDNMIVQIESLSEIASAFSDFAIMPVIKLSKVDAYKEASNTISLFEGLPNIDIQFSGETAYIKGDEKQLRRVFINLIKNAVQALEGLSQGIIKVNIIKQDGRVMVFVKDNGKGITEDKIDKIFLPNFSTKSGGTGLGLAMVKNIMTNFGGTIELVETSENGTIFRLNFPEMNETAAENE